MKSEIGAKNETIRRFILCTTYSVAMAYVESAVVVYLRLAINRGTRLFPLSQLPHHLLQIELAREIATIVMLAAVAALQSRRFRIAIAYFIYCFGVWDLFYYLWLKLLIGWPASLLSRDVLFLIPLPWLGPVLSPSIVSLILIGTGIAVLRLEALGTPLKLTPGDWFGAAVGAGLILTSYTWGVSRFGFTRRPGGYPWWLFILGAAIWAGVFLRRIVLVLPTRQFTHSVVHATPENRKTESDRR
ncbi:MAG TPA: hypothetical protein VMW69_15325 [Spirochaetia bacterium]|nr:hypothetical protein [Spirochaetia bacterium]